VTLRSAVCPVCRTPSTANGACPACGRTAAPDSASHTIVVDPRIQAALPVGAADELPARFGQYRVVRELGRGGMGRVLEAVDEPLGRRIAVKVLLVPSAEKDVRHRRFLEEARITGGLEHPGIVPIYNLGRAADGSSFFSMKLVAGRSLGDLLTDREKGDRAAVREWTLPRLVSVFERVVETIAYAHAKGFLHRDLKPANIMVGSHGEVWVLDWGLAKSLRFTTADAVAPTEIAAPGATPELSTAGSSVGTPQYMAPEQARGQPTDVRADVFGLGGILYKTLTGRPPFQGPDYMGTLLNAALGEIPPVRATPRGRRAPAALAAIAQKCLAPKADDRYAAAEDLLLDLRAYTAGEAVRAHPDGWIGALVRRARRHHRLVAVAAAVFVLLLVGSTLVAGWLAAKDRRALAAEREARSMQEKAQEAERDRQAALAETAARAQRRTKAFAPYAEAIDLLLRGQKYDRAAQLLEEALATDREFPEAQFALGEALRLSGLPDRAAPAYLKAAELSRQITGRPHLQALLAAGMSFDGAGDYKAAQRTFLEAERDGADHPLALVGKAFRLGQDRRFREARASAEEALRLAPHLWETQFASGYALEEMVNQGLVAPSPHHEQAVALFRKAQELSPRQAEVWVWLGHASAHSGTAAGRAAALQMFERALTLEPRNGNRYVTRGLARLNFGDAQGAADDFQKARDLKAARPLLLSADATLAVRRGDTETAFRLTGEILREKQDWPGNVGNWLAYGFQLRRDEEIRGRFDEWCRQNPEYPEVYALKAQVKARNGDLAGAIVEDRAGLAVAPYNVKLRVQLATHQALSRNWAEALRADDAVLELVPLHFPMRKLRVRCLAELGRGEEAKSLLDQLQQENPGRVKEIEELRSELAAKLPK
jgi:tetratricopeptide (TPR) repeat protein